MFIYRQSKVFHMFTVNTRRSPYSAAPVTSSVALTGSATSSPATSVHVAATTTPACVYIPAASYTVFPASDDAREKLPSFAVLTWMQRPH